MNLWRNSMKTTVQAAPLLGFKSDARVRQLIADELLKATKYGKTWLIEESEIERFNNEKKNKKKGKLEKQLGFEEVIKQAK